MISLDCHHPDLEEFIDVKKDLDKVTQANISVRITDDFMEAVRNDEYFELSFTRENTGETIFKIVRAKEVFHKLCEANWDNAEPGMLFWDRIKDWNLLSNDENFHYAGVNPCGEEPLPSYGSCLLGSINLSEFVDNPFTETASIDYDKLYNTTKTAVCYLNEILDEGLSLHPLQGQRDTVKNYRQIGLGIMGLADMLIKLRQTYGSEKAVNICSRIAKTIQSAAITASSELAEKYGQYPMFTSSIFDTPFFNNCDVDRNKIISNGLRNSQLLTIAPTGTISTMLEISGGIEPIFAKSYTRKTESLKGYDEYYKVYTPIVKEYMESNHIGDEKDLPDFIVTSADINYKDRINMQAAFQSCIDASISSTINVPNHFTVEEVEDLYMYAWEMGLKGVTIYRAGCKRKGILVEDNNKKDSDDSNIMNTTDLLPRGFVVDVSDDLIGYKRKLNTGCGSLHMEVYSDEITGEPQETFINIGSSGGCERNYQFISRLISTALRGGVPIEAIVDQAKSIRPCIAYVNRTKTKGDTSPGTSCPSAIGIALTELHQKMKDRCFADFTEEDGESPLLEVECPVCEDELSEILKKEPEAASFKPRCPECGAEITHEGGCNICKNCGWSKCD